MEKPVFVDGDFLTIEAKNYYHTLFLHDLDQYAKGCIDNVARGLESPELASLQLETYGYGVGAALKIMECNTTIFWTRLDQLIISIDPNADINKKRRWQSKAGLLYAVDFEDITNSNRVNPKDTR